MDRKLSKPPPPSPLPILFRDILWTFAAYGLRVLVRTTSPILSHDILRTFVAKDLRVLIRRILCLPGEL